MSHLEDALDDIVPRLYQRYTEPFIFRLFVDNFGYTVTYEQMAVAAWGDTPEARRRSRLPQVRAHILSQHASRINKRLAENRQPYVIVTVRGVGYRMQDGDPTKDRPIRRGPKERDRILAKYHKMREEHPDMSQKQVCAVLRVNRWTLRSWLKPRKR